LVTASRDALAEVAGAHTPVWDANAEGLTLECGCGEFTHWGRDRAQAEQRFGAHVADALLASGVVRAVDGLAEDERAELVRLRTEHAQLLRIVTEKA